MLSYKDNPGLRGLGDSLSYGTIPESEYLRKIQVVPTSYQEDSENVENYMRNLMKDFRPDEPYLESDYKRDPSDRGSGPHSESVLNLRHAGVFGATDDPYLPDGTFLDHEFAERDPRGIATGPDMRKHYEQQLDRAAFIKFYNDDDYSVPSDGINPAKMISNIKAGFYPYKDRYKNFEESMDSWHNGMNGIVRQGGCDINKTSLDGTIMDLTESCVKTRRDAVAQLSGDPTVAYRYSTPDHRFKIAKYGMIRVNQDKSYQNWDNTRRSTYLNHANMAIIDGTRVNRMLANLIIDIEGLRDTKQIVTQGAAYSDSAVNQLSKKKLNKDDIYKIIRIGNVNTQALDKEIDGKAIHRYGKKPMNDQRNLSNSIQFNHAIVKNIEQATKKFKELDKEGFVNLRKKIEHSATENGIYKETSNRRLIEKYKSSNTTRNTEDNRYIEEQKEIFNYSGIKPSKERKDHDNIDYEKYGNESSKSVLRKGKRKENIIHSVNDNDQEQDQGRLDFGVYDKAKKADPSDHLGRNIDDYDFGDIAQLDEAKEVDLHIWAVADK